MKPKVPAHSILVVDDEADVRDALAEFLEYEGYRVTLAADGRHGLEEVRRQKPSAIILDIIMPVMSGTEMLQVMRGDPAIADVPVIISTSDPSRAPVGIHIMKKPVNLPRLLETLASVCSKRTPTV